MAAAVLSGLAREAAKFAAAKAIEKAGEQLKENPRGLWEGVKEAGHRLLSGDFGGLLQQGIDFFTGDPRKSPTDRVSEELADDDLHKRPKDVVRKNAIKRKSKLRRRKEDEIMEIPDEFFEEETIAMPEAPNVVREPMHWAKPEKVFVPSVSKAPTRVPQIRHVAGGVKHVPADPYAKLEFTSGSLFPRPKTIVERRRDMTPEVLSTRRRIIDQMERIYGPMDTTVRELRRQESASTYGNTSGPYVPPVSRLPPPSYREAMARKARENESLLSGMQPKQKHFDYPTLKETPAQKIAAEAKTGKPLKGAAKSSFEKAQIKISVPKKKLKK